MMQEFDLAIIGGGPAGLNAGVYASRFLLRTVIFAKSLGGMASKASEICNFLSYEKIKGTELTNKIIEQARSLGVRIVNEEVLDIEKSGKGFIVKTDNKECYAKKIILATGSKKRMLELEKEKEFIGKGISYCATCDSPLFKNKVVCVVGGGNSALTSALLLSEYAKEVYIAYRKSSFINAEPAYASAVKNKHNIKPIFNVNVIQLYGSLRLDSVGLDNGKILTVDGLFVEIGLDPEINLALKLGLKLSNGFIEVDKQQKTSLRGVFAAGDVCDNSLKQIIVAASEGAVAATYAYQEIKKEM